MVALGIGYWLLVRQARGAGCQEEQAVGKGWGGSLSAAASVAAVVAPLCPRAGQKPDTTTGLCNAPTGTGGEERGQ